MAGSARRVRSAAASPGAVIVSRGGAQTDSYADVLYLANHYNVFPLLADRPPHWSGHSHCAFVIGLEGEPTLIDSFGEYPDRTSSPLTTRGFRPICPRGSSRRLPTRA